MADSPDFGSAAGFPIEEFDPSWLRRKTTLQESFDRDVRQRLIDEDDGGDPEMVEEFRAQLAAERGAVSAVWRDGDELWEWRNARWGRKLEAMDSVGEMGIAVVRAGVVVAAWVTGTWG